MLQIYGIPFDITDIEQAKTDDRVQSGLTYMTVRSIVEIICFSRYSCKLFIYLITGKQFRKHLRMLSPCRVEKSDIDKWVMGESSGSDNKEVTKLISAKNLTSAQRMAITSKKKVRLEESDMTTCTTLQ